MSSALSRRQLLALAALSSLSVSLPMSAEAAAAKKPKRAKKPSVPPSGKTVAILGDSMIAGAVGLFLERALQETYGHEVVRHGKSSTGLARPDFYNWQEAGPKAVQGTKTDAVIAMFGGNDAQSLRTGTTNKSGWIHWGEPEWEAEYRRRIQSFAQAVAPVPTKMLWIGMPVMRPEKLNARVQLLNQIYRSEISLREAAQFIDIWDALTDDAGQYQDRLPITEGGKKKTMRAPDGVHMTVAGAHYLVDTIAPQIHAHIMT